MANNSTRDILQRMSDHLEDLEGLDYEKTQPLPDDVTDLDTFLTPGIYRVDHPEDVAHGPLPTYNNHPYILTIKSKLDAAPSWCQQYAIILGLQYFRSRSSTNSIISNLNGYKWGRVLDENGAASYLTYGSGIGGIMNGASSVNIQSPNESFCPMFVTVYTADGQHFALFAVVNDPFATGASKWIVNSIVSDSEISLTRSDSAEFLTLTRSGSLLSYDYVFYTFIKSVKR